MVDYVLCCIYVFVLGAGDKIPAAPHLRGKSNFAIEFMNSCIMQVLSSLPPH